MRLSILTLLALCVAHGNGQGLLGHLGDGTLNTVGGALNRPTGVCNRNVYQDFRKSQKSIYTRLYKRVAAHSDNHFVFSPYTIWLTISALAEGANPSIQPRLFQFLNLPLHACLRMNYYRIALNVEQSGRDVSLLRKRELVIDQSLTINPSWRDLTRAMGLLDVSFAPIKVDPVATTLQLRQFLVARSNITVTSGNSILLDSLDYQGLWSSAFPAASVRPEPFYNDHGQQIAVVNMMRKMEQARMALLPFMNAIALELPMGVDGRYKMLITTGFGNGLIKNAIHLFMGAIPQIFSRMRMSLEPIEIAVPLFEMTSEFNARPFLEDIGLGDIFNNPAATSLVSHPPALPDSLIQRVTISVGPSGVNPAPVYDPRDPVSGPFQLATDSAHGLAGAAAAGRKFVANKPFLYGLFDTKTDTCLFAGAYARP